MEAHFWIPDACWKVESSASNWPSAVMDEKREDVIVAALRRYRFSCVRDDVIFARCCGD